MGVGGGMVMIEIPGSVNGNVTKADYPVLSIYFGQHMYMSLNRYLNWSIVQLLWLEITSLQVGDNTSVQTRVSVYLFTYV